MRHVLELKIEVIMKGELHPMKKTKVQCCELRLLTILENKQKQFAIELSPDLLCRQPHCDMYCEYCKEVYITCNDFIVNIKCK